MNAKRRDLVNSAEVFMEGEAVRQLVDLSWTFLFDLTVDVLNYACAMFEALKTATVRFWKELTSRLHIAGDSKWTQVDALPGSSRVTNRTELPPH